LLDILLPIKASGKMSNQISVFIGDLELWLLSGIKPLVKMHGYGYLDFTILFYNFDLPMLTTSKYTPFTTLSISTRFYCNSKSGYSFRFNGKELDKEIYGNGNALDFGARIYDPRLAKWFSVDPKFKMFSDQSPYNFGANSPVWLNDVDGEIIQPTTTNSQQELSNHFGRVFNHRMAKLLSNHIGLNGKPNPVKNLSFWIASIGLNRSQKQLARFYRLAINDNKIIKVTIGKSTEKTDDGTTIGSRTNDAGGESTEVADPTDESQVVRGHTFVATDYPFINLQLSVMDKDGNTQGGCAENGTAFDLKSNGDLDEAICHGILGHGGYEGLGRQPDQLFAIKISNIYRTMKGLVMRTGINDGHFNTRDPKTKKAHNLDKISP
jgi:RHS repeat-associated protein